MINFKELTLDRLLDIKKAHYRYEKNNIHCEHRWWYHRNVIISINAELFRRYNSVRSK